MDKGEFSRMRFGAIGQRGKTKKQKNKKTKKITPPHKKQNNI